jgi:putative phosphoribosyl transferase
MEAKLHEQKKLRNEVFVFKDRFEAGKILAEMLEPNYKGSSDALVLAIPAGGIPVGMKISQELQVPFELVIVRKIQIPGNTEAGFGAMTVDGSVFFNEELLSYLNLNPAQIETQKKIVEQDLAEREKLFRGSRAFPDLRGKTAILADDGLASGYTMMASIHMARNKGARKIVVAVPTAPLRSIKRIESLADEIFCANVRETSYFAVADAYENWHDLTRSEVLELLAAKD